MTITISGYADGESWEFQNVPYEVAEAVATILNECERDSDVRCALISGNADEVNYGGEE